MEHVVEIVGAEDNKMAADYLRTSALRNLVRICIKLIQARCVFVQKVGST